MPATTRSTPAHADGHNEALPAPKAHAALALLAAAPLVLPVDSNVNVIATAALAVYVGCWRSAKAAGPAESMSRKVCQKEGRVGLAGAWQRGSIGSRARAFFSMVLLSRTGDHRQHPAPFPPGGRIRPVGTLSLLPWVGGRSRPTAGAPPRPWGTRTLPTQFSLTSRSPSNLFHPLSTSQDAMKFPLIGSAVLVSLFVAFRFLPRHLVNAALTLYFVALGTAALAAAVLPFVEAAFPQAVRAKSYMLAKDLRIPYALPDPTDVELTVPEAVAGAAAAAGCAWYGFRKHWLANNALGLAFSLTGIEHLSLGSVSTGAILLGGLFVYDVFWVFCTPVMVTVAKSFDAPIKLLFPRSLAAARGAVGTAAAAAGGAAATKTASMGAPFSMLGLGDIVIPGIFVALLLRFDRSPGRGAGKASYFKPAFGGYVSGLVATIVVMNVFQAAQPALLYIVPAVLGAVGAAALARGEVAAVMGYSEEEEEGEGGSKEKATPPAKSPAKKGTPAKKRE